MQCEWEDNMFVFSLIHGLSLGFRLPPDWISFFNREL